MKRIFTGTFFQFVMGFMGILAISFVILIAVGYYGSESGQNHNSALLEADTLTE
jgi:divalent metal cation (Fe/Co/Zn/Cd) transporter